MESYWVESAKSVVPYNYKSHAHKLFIFVYWENQGDIIIISGPEKIITDRDKVYAVASTIIFDSKIPIPNYLPDGAGYVQCLKNNPQIVQWANFNSEMPAQIEYRQRIVKALGVEDPELSKLS